MSSHQFFLWFKAHVFRVVPCVLALACLYFFSAMLATKALHEGGRWTLGQPLAMADRVIEGGGYYNDPQTQDFLSETAYFPGVALLATALTPVFESETEKVMLILAVGIGVLFILSLMISSVLMGSDLGVAFVLTLSVNFALLYNLGWIHYMQEFKPDAAMLAFGVLVFWFIAQDTFKRAKTGPLFLFGIFLFFAAIFKQQAIAFYIGSAFLILVSKDMLLEDKFKALVAAFISGVTFLIVLFVTPYCFENTISTMARHTFQNWALIKKSLMLGVKQQAILYIILSIHSVSLYVLCKSKQKFIDHVSIKWLLFFTPWCALQMLSFFKSGGNHANIEVALICFLPLGVVAVDRLIAESIKTKSLFCVAVLFLMLAFINHKEKFSHLLHDKNVKEYEAVVFLEKRFKGKYAFYYSGDYTLLKKAGIQAGPEIVTVSHFRSGGRDLNKIIKSFQTHKYDLVLSSIGLSILKDEIGPYYKPLEEPDVPELLQGRVFVPVNYKEKNF